MKKGRLDFINNFKPSVRVYSPGRINFIGEHTDYNNGFVMPTAIDKKITVSLAQNGSEKLCRVYSENYDSNLEINLEEVLPSDVVWENYILGVVFQLIQKTSLLRGFDCLIESDLPVGSGISSSAALECGLASGLNELFNLNITKEEIVLLSQKAEHTFVGTKCGVMDQYASVMSIPEKVILLDCKTAQHRYIQANFHPYKIVLLNTNVSHSLADSAYNKRRQECETVVTHLLRYDTNIESLRDVSKSLLESHKSEISPTQYKRASYVLEENDRVLTAAGSLDEGDLKRFGELMYDSHRGLQHKYDVSCEELDFLVDFSEGYDQVIGSRMMGGGFGGCTINLVRDDYVATYIHEVTLAYKKAFGIDLTSFLTVPSGGTIIENL